MKQKLLSLLALLLMMTQGAWAQVLSGNLPGKFTINADGDQVCFSQGNFQAIGTTESSKDGGWTWAFAEHQWDKIGDAVANNKVSSTSANAGTISEDGTVDLFGWSSNWYYGIYYANATPGNVFIDWGELAISNGGNTANLGWFTLSQDEWVWVLGPSNDTPNPGTNCRTSSTVNEVANARFAKGSVNYINGLIIFPDVYTHPAGVAQPTNINNKTCNYEGNTYTTAQWTSMEAAGCVFLPAGGQRTSATAVSNDNATGCYWSGTSSNDTRAYNIKFTADDLKCEKTTSSHSLKRSGESVRLAFPVPATLAEGTDNSTWITVHKDDVDPSNVMLTRTLQAGGWNTFSVPFDITPIPTGWTVKKLTDAEISGGDLTLTFADETTKIEAGKPYLVKVAKNAVNPIFLNVAIKDDVIPTTIAGVISFMPAINPTSLTANDKSVLFISGGNSLAYPSTTNNLKGFRAYFQLLGGSVEIKSYSMDFVDEEVTGIIDVTTDNGQQTTGGWYTIDGRRLEGEPTEKGVYIQNGKKVIIK